MAEVVEVEVVCGKCKQTWLVEDIPPARPSITALTQSCGYSKHARPFRSPAAVSVKLKSLSDEGLNLNPLRSVG